MNENKRPRKQKCPLIIYLVIVTTPPPSHHLPYFPPVSDVDTVMVVIACGVGCCMTAENKTAFFLQQMK